MRALLTALSVFAAAPAFADNIDQVLHRSQSLRLQTLAAVGDADPRGAVIRGSFQRLLDAGHRPPDGVELRVVEGPIVAECLFGRMVVANVSLANLTEGERLFVLAHELGHLINAHWAHFGSAFRKHVPGEVVQEHTDAVDALLGPEMSALAYRHEYDADAYGLRALQQFGFGLETVLASFVRHGVQHDTATHPGTRKRVAHLRVIENRQ